jgi:hypothetical protein
MYPRQYTAPPEPRYDLQDTRQATQGLGYGPELSAKQLTDLAKLYTDEMKYGSGTYDVLASKTKIFRDVCSRLAIPEWHYAYALPAMLKGQALAFYYDHLIAGPRDFDSMANRIQTHFETEEGRQAYLAEWQVTTLHRTIEHNPGKTKAECLDILIEKLVKLQRALPNVNQAEATLRDQLLNACRGIKECNNAIFAPAPTYEGVRSQLRRAIAIEADAPAQ